ncbi:MAG TPA: hypothetical protein VES65_11410 [Solirubrobacteraceae bacterium]|nr:hypothetical protein [Solirubrobacteraceae bacterium]
MPDSQPAELYLALRDGDTVHCTCCGRMVDCEKYLQLVRRRDGRLLVTRCHHCVAGDSLDIAGVVTELLEQLGPRQTLRQLERILFLPTAGSRWRWRSSTTEPETWTLEFARTTAAAGDDPFANVLCMFDQIDEHGARNPVMFTFEEWQEYVRDGRAVRA